MRSHLPILALVLCLGLPACSSGGGANASAAYATSGGYFVDLRSVPLDRSNLGLGSQTIKFRAYSVAAATKGWTPELTAALKSSIVAAKGPEDPKLVPTIIDITPMAGVVGAVDVAVTVDLDGPGTWQIDLPATCYDYKVMGFNGPGVIGLKGPLPPPPNPLRPEAYGCHATTVMTVGSCPHVAYSEAVAVGKGTGTDVWRVVWSEATPEKVLAEPKTYGVDLARKNGSPEAKVGPASISAQSASVVLATVQKAPPDYRMYWSFVEGDGVAASFTSLVGDCGLKAGGAIVGAKTPVGVDESFLRHTIATPGAMVGLVKAKDLPPKPLPGSGD
jgi:hypothetical protein